MRILIAASGWFPDWKGGNARVISDTSRWLATAGHEVTVLAPASKDYPAVELDGSLTIRRVIKQGRLPITFTSYTQARKQGRKLSTQQFDLVLSHSSPGSCGLAVSIKAPIVLVYHAPVVRELRFETKHQPIGPRRLARHAVELPLMLFEKRAVKLARRLLVLSDFSRDQLTSDHPDAASRIRHVSGGVDADVFSPGGSRDAARERLGITPEGPLLVTIRRLEPRMGLQNLVLAMLELRPTTGATLAVIGTGSMAEDLRRLAGELGLEDSVQLLGRVADEDLVDWYRAADLFVLPTVAYEGFGMVTAEALAAGTPVVGTPVGATPELLEPLDPRLVAGGVEPSALASAAAQALEFADDEFRERCREYACERYSWQNVMPDWEVALKEVVER